MYIAPICAALSPGVTSNMWNQPTVGERVLFGLANIRAWHATALMHPQIDPLLDGWVPEL